MNHSKHSYLMIGLLVIGAGLFFTGSVGGGVLFLLWPLACVGMMFFMMRAMSGMGHDAPPPHPDVPADHGVELGKDSRGGGGSDRTAAHPAGAHRSSARTAPPT